MSHEAGYIHEPFNPNRSPGWIAEPLPYWFMHICVDNEAFYEPAVRRVIEMRYPLTAPVRRSRSARQFALHPPETARSIAYRVRRMRALLKDPLAIFSAEWLADRFAAQVVVMIRHPAAFVSSIKKLNWGFDYERHWLGQELLMRDYLSHRAEQFRNYVGEVDIVGEGIVVWNAIYDVVAGYRERHPDWAFVRHEDLAGDPRSRFQELYGRVGLTWDDDVGAAIDRYAASGNPKEVPGWRRRAIKRDSKAASRTWRQRLSADEIARIRAGTEEVSSLFYSEEDWER